MPPTARLPLVDPAWLDPLLDDAARDLIHGKGKAGSPLYLRLGNSPAMLSAWLKFAWSLRLDPESSRGLRELAIVLVGRRWGAPFEVAAHVPMALEAGNSPEKVEALTTWSESDLFDETERAVLALTEAMLTNSVTDAHTGAVESLLGRSQLVEIVLTIGFYFMVSSVTQAIGLVPGE